MATLLKTLTLTLGDAQVECQLSRCEITDEPTTSEAQTFCGTDTFSTSNYKLNLEGFQDWTDVEGVCNIIHQAYIVDPVPAIDYQVTLGSPPVGADPDNRAYRSGQCKPTSDVPFGGAAGDPLAFTQVLDCTGRPDETALA